MGWGGTDRGGYAEQPQLKAIDYRTGKIRWSVPRDGGNPGRHEIDDTQELNYRFVMQAIADLGGIRHARVHASRWTRSHGEPEKGDGDLHRIGPAVPRRRGGRS
jgi:hypothetical protein